MVNSMATRRALLAAVLLSTAMPAFADTCGGQFLNRMVPTSMPTTSDETLQGFMVTAEITSPDSGFNGAGHCVGYVRTLPNGKALIANTCSLKAADGDVWGVAGMQEAGAARGWWVTTHGTGKFAEAPGSMGWFENIAQDDKGVSGKWGGDCKGTK